MGLEFLKNYFILRTGYHETPPYFSFDFIIVGEMTVSTDVRSTKSVILLLIKIP